MEESLTLDKKRRKYLEKYRTNLNNKLNEQEALLDKYLLVITSVMLNIILFFIDKVIKLNTAIHIEYFYFAILFSIISIITIITSILRSNYIIKELSNIINEGLNQDKEIFEKEKKYLKSKEFPCTKFNLNKFITYNHISAVSVCISIILISYFLYLNIEKSRNIISYI